MNRRAGMAALVLLALGACAREIPPATSIDITEVLSGSSEGYNVATGPMPLDFPRAHGQHPTFRTEWWYFVGNLRGANGGEFGYQLTLFRSALAPQPATAPGASAWRARHVYMAHLAVSDSARGQFVSVERFARAGAGLAGAAEDTLDVWLEDWRARMSDPVSETISLVARDQEIAIDLTLTPTKPRVLHGANGYSRKGQAPANASYYYSYPRMQTRGRLRLGAREFEVAGTSWFDREWSSSALESGQVGWDWFAIRLADGRDLMLYVLRREDGSVDVNSAATLVSSTGEVRGLSAEDFDVEATGSWTSPRGGTYPSGWRIRVPSAAIDLVVSPHLIDQELDHAFRYWEGAVRVDAVSGEPLGEGFVELTGYSGGAAP